MQTIIIIFLICFCIVVFGKTYSMNTDMRFIKICNETSPISFTEMNEVLINKKLTGENSNDFKCFLHCLFTKYEWMDEDGGFHLTEIRNILEEANIDPALLEYILYKCTALMSVDRCERAFKFIECFWGRVKEYESEKDETFLYNLQDWKI